jgi:hypothetical protein
MSPSTVRFWEQADVVLELIGFLDVRDAIALICVRAVNLAFNLLT